MWFCLISPVWIFLLNSLAPGKFEWNFRYVIVKQILVIDGWGISCEIALIWMSLDFTDDQSTLVQVMAWCHQATSHYLHQCWPRSLSPYGITRPQWVKISFCQILLIWIIHSCALNSSVYVIHFNNSVDYIAHWRFLYHACKKFATIWLLKKIYCCAWIKLQLILCESLREKKVCFFSWWLSWYTEYHSWWMLHWMAYEYWITAINI